jgi:hypothetical protein
VVAVDYVESEENRNVQASLFDGNVLEAVDFFGIGHPKDGAGTVLLQNFFHRPAYGLLELINFDTGELGELGYFFCLGHLMQQIQGFLVDLFFAGWDRDGGLTGCQHGVRENNQEYGSEAG